MSTHPELSAAFEQFARVEAPDLDSPMYAEFAAGVARDGELLALAARRQAGQPAPNMLFGAVQYLLLQGVEHPLAAHYPILSGSERPQGPAFLLFRAFCLEHRERVAELIATRRTQTQVVRRCTCLLPAFGLVFREAAAPLALIDVGASAGLNLNFDRYAYRYLRAGREVLRWGSDTARVALQADLRGPGTLPEPPEEIPVASRDGIDVNPIDLADRDELLWLRALIWPEHVERHGQLVDATAELKSSPIRLHRGTQRGICGACWNGSLPNRRWSSTRRSPSTRFLVRAGGASRGRWRPKAGSGPFGGSRSKASTRRA